MRSGFLIGLVLAVAGGVGCAGGGPKVLSAWPADGATGVPLDARIEVTFDLPVRLAGADAGLTLRLDGEPIPGDLSVGEGGGPLMLTPTHFLLAGKTYDVELAAEAVTDLAGRTLDDPLHWRFTALAGCQPQPAAAGLAHAGPLPDGSLLIPGGRRISPAGTLAEAGSFPMNLVAWPDRERVAVINSGNGLGSSKEQSIELFDGLTGELLYTAARPRPQSLFYGLALSADGQRLYAASGGTDLVEILELSADDRSLEPVGEFSVPGYPAGLLLDEPRGLLYVSAQLDNDVVAVELASGRKRWRKPVGSLPYDLALTPAADKLYVSLWGRSTLGTPGQVAVLDPDSGQLLTKIDVGKNPEGLAMASDGRLFVACADADRVDVIDTHTDTLAASWELRRSPQDPVGLSPADVALDEGRGRLYVACAQKNAIDVLDLRSGRPLGSIPTAWYPTALALRPDGRLLITCGKGLGAGPNLGGGDIHRSMTGSLSIVDPPDDAALGQGADQVKANNDYPLTFFPDRCLGRAFPLPRAIGEPSPIKHVIFVLRENKTYDQNLGDLEAADGDPSLVMFGETITPNLHALAREFCNLDNFYAEVEVSVQGHYWNVAGTINDYAERIWHANYRDDSRFPATGTQQPDYPGGGFVWHKLLETGIGFRDYGEPMGVVGEVGTYGDYINQDYMLDLGLNLYNTPDAQRVEWFWQEVEAGIFPSFVYLALLNDHTYGSRAGAPTPQWMVAENDYATGLLVDRISHSKYWPETLIIITEDDPQSGADHIDGHRSIAMMISPYTRKGYTTSVHHGFSSLIRTYGLILGMPALGQLDEAAAPVYDCFTSQPDFATYQTREMNVQYQTNQYGMPGVWESEALDLSAPDRAVGLGQVLWLATHPDDPIPPQLEELDERPGASPDEAEAAEERLILPVPLE